jgi:urea carboxylase-associated protein 1
MNSHAIPESARVVLDAEIPARKPWSAIIRKGQTLRLIDSHGQQAVDTLFYSASDPQERYSGQDTLRAQGSAYVGVGDSCGLHDTSAGACSCESNTVRFGHDTKYLHACRENFLIEAAKHGLSKRDIVPNLNFFMNVPIDPSGNFTVVDGVSKPGDTIAMVAEMDVLCLISNCPQVNNPCNGFFPTPVRVVIYEAQKD